MTPLLLDRHVLILGLGTSGLAMARWCALQGAQVDVWDSRESPPQAPALATAAPGARLRSGELTADDLGTVRWVLKSPGLAPHDPLIAPLLAAAEAVGVAVGGELDLFTHALGALKQQHGYSPKVLAITGTNGKTTTTAMCALLVERTGRRVAAAGNIGPTMLDTLADALARETWPSAAEPGAVAAPVESGAAAAADVASSSSDADAAAGSVSEVGVESADDTRQALRQDTVAHATPQAAAHIVDPDDAESSLEPAPAQSATDPGTDMPVAAELPDDEAPLVLAPPPPAAPTFDALPEVWVLELSSFQLHGVRGFEPDAAVVLNISQDHLDWHGSLQAYTDDKAGIYGTQAVMVVNRDDLAVEAMVPAPVVLKATGRGQRARTVSRAVVRFGLDAPQRPGDYGLVVEQGMAWLVRALQADDTPRKGRTRGAAVDDEPIVLQRLMPADALRVRGRHNAANALAALALATAIGCPLAPMLHGLREYRGEPHRVAFVATVGGIDAFDDSKGTNVGATVAALEGLGADRAPARLAVILGGDGKGQDFSPLVAPVLRHARAVALIGRDGPAIGQVLQPALVGHDLPLAQHDDLPQAVAWCFDQARTGDAVLLSPACASLDMFRHYGHRAEVFVAAVQARAEAQGETVL